MSDDLVKRLRDWRHVYPEDEDKPEGHLYQEAAGHIEELEAEVEGALAIIATERAEVMELRAENQRLREAISQSEGDGVWVTIPIPSTPPRDGV